MDNARDGPGGMENVEGRGDGDGETEGAGGGGAVQSMVDFGGLEPDRRCGPARTSGDVEVIVGQGSLAVHLQASDPGAGVAAKGCCRGFGVKRKRGKYGPEARIAPMEESAVSRAIRTRLERPMEPWFLPSVGTEFSSLKEAKDFYNLYSWEIGFGIRKGRNKVNGNEYTTRQDLVCSCEGVCPKMNAESWRTGCKAMVRLHRSSDHGWVITRADLEHNHVLSGNYGQNKQWPSHSDIDATTKETVRRLRENNIPIGRVCSILGVHGPDSQAVIRKESVRALCASIAQENIKDDIGKTMSILDEMKVKDAGMEVRFMVDDDGKIKSMLWCTGKNRADYVKFGDVVTFDTTYRTNLYNMPFGLFIGVNNHFQSIVFGGVLLTSEKTEDFEWAFSKFVDIMGGKEPITILTDQCQAMAAAIASTLKGSNHRWCRWHVLRKTKQKVGPVYSKKSAFKKEFNRLVTEETNALKFERKWRQLMRKYKLENNQFMQRIFKFRAKWAKPYFMDIFCAGMTSTQRSESANHMLKKFIQRSAPMHMFVRKFSEFQLDRNDQEGKEVHLTQQRRRKWRVGVPIERHAARIYTRRVYDKFYNELFYCGAYVIKSRTDDNVFEVAHSALEGKCEQVLYRVWYEPGEKVRCQCGLYEHVGILCRHSLKVLVHLDVTEVPKGNVTDRWMRNLDEIEECSGSKSGVVVCPGAAGALWKRSLVNLAMEVASAQEGMTQEDYLEVMAVMDRVRARRCSQVGSVVQRQLEGEDPGCVGGCSSLGIANMRCPDRPAKKGRPPNCSLSSWKAEQKRKKVESTDEERPANGKTRLISDVLGC